MTQMYNISSYDPGAYLTNLKNIALQKYNQQMGASGAGADISLPTASQATNIASKYLGVLPNLKSSPEGLTSIYTGVPPGAKQQIMDTGFTGNKVFATPDIETARTYAIDSKNLRGTGLGKQTGDILEAQVPTSQVEDMLKKGALGTREIVLDPESASKVYQEGIGNIVESPSLRHKVFKTLSRTLPIAGGVLAVGDAVQRAQEGDYAGAALSGLGTLPVVGIPATLTQYATDALGLTGQEREEGLASLPEVQPTYTYDPEQLDYYDDPENNPYINHMGLATFGNRPISFEPLNYNVYDPDSAVLPVYAPDFTSAEQANKFYGAYRFYNRNNPELLEQYGLQY